jgi:hypothetical protein
MNTSSSPPLEQACFWMAKRPPRRPPEPLEGGAEADIAIVVGGYTGLWTALFLKELEPRRKVALLEQELLGYGGSGLWASTEPGKVHRAIWCVYEIGATSR